MTSDTLDVKRAAMLDVTPAVKGGGIPADTLADTLDVWCGARATDKRNGRLYRYTVYVGAGLRPRPALLGAPHGSGKVFCSVSCFDSYSG